MPFSTSCSCSPSLSPHFLVAVFLFLSPNIHLVLSCYTSIFSFGDSLADTGNLLHSQPDKAYLISRFPYGQTYFDRPTGRFSDGRLVLDFIGILITTTVLLLYILVHCFLENSNYMCSLFFFPLYFGLIFIKFCCSRTAQAFGIPLLPPYLGCSSGQDLRQGVNFAVGGATALDAVFFEERGIRRDVTNNSLWLQLGWFEELLPSLCNNTSSKTPISDDHVNIVCLA